MRQLHLAGFMIAGPVVHSHAMWRQTEADLGFLEPEIYQHVAQTLERGCFDLVFFADRLAMSSRYGESLETGVTYGDQDAVRLDPVPVLAMMAAATQRLGLGATRSTTYYHPYHIARTFATLDHLTRGRAAWNVVTSVNDGEAQNFGLEEHLAHDLRYDRADEFMEVAMKLWESWQVGALLLDQESGLFADPHKVAPIDHAGQWFRSRGPLNVPRSPQGRPVIIQAGSSGRGQTFAARWADVIFAIQPDAQIARTTYRAMKAQVQAMGRSPDDCKILLAVMPFIGATDEEGQAKLQRHNQLVHPLVGLSTLSSHANHNLAQHPLDEQVATINVQGMQGLFATVARMSAAQDLTLRDIGRLYGQSVLVPQIAGSAHSVAAQLEALFTDGTCDGFVISPSVLPHAFEEFVELVVPLLQQRGIFRQAYEGTTLREHLGLQGA